MEKDTPCLARLPSRKVVLAILIVLALVLTLIFVHLSGQWVGQRIFKQKYIAGTTTSRKLESGGALITRLQTPERTGRTDSLQTERSPSSSETSSLVTLGSPGERRGGKAALAKSHWREIFLREKEDRTKSVSTHDPDTVVPGYQTAGAESALRATIREAIEEAKVIKATPGETDPSSAKADKYKYMYSWNDRDRNSIRSLPLRDRNDDSWKREDALIFNRVGKCGSRSVITLLRKLSKLNQFNLLSSVVYNTTSISVEWQHFIVKTLDQMQTPYLLQRHLHFVDFNDFHARQPMYINIIRDPLARFVSNYYFRRFGDGRSNQHFKGSEEDKYRSVTKCILQRHSECIQKGLFYIIPFFCGQQKACRKPSQWALDRAKQNVEKHFVAVGILEDLEGTFQVFEKLVPQFFKGVVKLFLEPDEEQLKKNSSTLTKFKEKPSPEAAAIMKSLMKYEYEFYYFVKDRLERLKEQYGIRTESS